MSNSADQKVTTPAPTPTPTPTAPQVPPSQTAPTVQKPTAPNKLVPDITLPPEEPETTTVVYRVAAAENKRLYKDIEFLNIVAEKDGVVVSHTDDFTIVPVLAKKGENTVLVLRHNASAQVKANDLIGIVVPV